MYSTKLINKGMVDGNAYITVGDPFADAKPNPFRQGKKGEKLTPFQTKVSLKQSYFLDNYNLFFLFCSFLSDDPSERREWTFR